MRRRKKNLNKKAIPVGSKAEEKPMSQQSEDRFKFLERVNMEPAEARVHVRLSLEITVGTWGKDCTVAQAVAQATEDATKTVARLIHEAKANNIRILRADSAQVVCVAREAK